MLSSWKEYEKKMVSIIPNSHSVAYRLWKYILEKKGAWHYGIEMRQSSLKDEFETAGISVLSEYTIGVNHALSFLPRDHYFICAMEMVLSEVEAIDNWGQGYLLVAVGDCEG